mmetsp:Transcript_24189/g.69991  ORF Transcript_24189/g.69991 Transcript_24189/m.69991 type:complete len:221 (+) Transcript_24189:187-849(+)
MAAVSKLINNEPTKAPVVVCGLRARSINASGVLPVESAPSTLRRLLTSSEPSSVEATLRGDGGNRLTADSTPAETPAACGGRRDGRSFDGCSSAVSRPCRSDQPSCAVAPSECCRGAASSLARPPPELGSVAEVARRGGIASRAPSNVARAGRNSSWPCAKRHSEPRWQQPPRMKSAQSCEQARSGCALSSPRPCAKVQAAPRWQRPCSKKTQSLVLSKR